MVTMESAIPAVDTLDRPGGHVALDFVNTVDSWRDGQPGTDYLHDFDALLGWCLSVGLIDEPAGRRFGKHDARTKRAALRRARVFRDTLHALFDAVAGERPLPRESIDDLERVLRSSMRWRRLEPRGATLVVTWDFSAATADALLGPIAWSSADLLQRGPVDRIKACPPAEGCGWLFLDLSKNRSRTWCSMKTCGNSAKVRRYRKRR